MMHTFASIRGREGGTERGRRMRCSTVKKRIFKRGYHVAHPMQPMQPRLHHVQRRELTIAGHHARTAARSSGLRFGALPTVPNGGAVQ